MTEFELIARIGQLFAGVPRNGFEEPGDDCTVLGIGGGESLLFTADLLTEGIHFLRNTTPPYELGRKALAVNLSDVAAMGGRSVATLLSVALPPDVSDEWTEAFLRGYRDLSAEEGVMLAGGDTTSSRHDITVNVTVVGRAADHCIKRRSDARAGDAIVVAGVLGASGAGLRDLLAGNLDTPNARIHNAPAAQTAEGLWLGERTEVHAMTDLSDGLASDLRHIAEQSPRTTQSSGSTAADVSSPTGAGTNTTPEPVPAGRRTASVRKIFRKGRKSFETADLFAILGA